MHAYFQLTTTTKKARKAKVGRPVKGTPRRKRKRTGPPLKEVVLVAMKKSGGEMKAADLPQAVKKAGYKTTAKKANFRTQIYNTLSGLVKEKKVKKVKAGVYKVSGRK